MILIVQRRGLTVASYFTRVVLFIFYLATIISYFISPWNVYADLEQIYLIVGNVLLIIGIVVFILTFIGDIISYLNEKKR